VSEIPSIQPRNESPASAPRIDATPTDGLSYDPNEPKFWDRAGLDRELLRAFDICHGCRLCFNLCPSFPALFGAVDAHGGDVRALSAHETSRVVDTCYQCRICTLKCPYTPQDGHPFQLDFARLMMRRKALDARRDGLRLRERVLGNPDAAGRFARPFAPLVNLGNRLRPARLAMEAVLGVHRDAPLPEFHAETFQRWFEANRAGLALDGGNGRVALFATCFTNYNNPALGRAVVDVLARNRATVRLAPHGCCGMPAMDGGDVESARRLAADNVARLLPLVHEGFEIVAPDPSCTLLMRRDYPWLVGTPEAREVAAAVRDVCEFLFTLKRSGRLDRSFRSTPQTVAWHVPCHLRAQGIGYRSRDVMRTIPGTEVEAVEECCGHDGTWGMKKEFRALSLQAGARAFEGIRAAGANVVATDCPLAALQLGQALGGERPVHPVQILARAYLAPGEGGFDAPVASAT